MHGILSYDDFYAPTEIISVELCAWSDLFPHMPSATQRYNSMVSALAVVCIISASHGLSCDFPFSVLTFSPLLLPPSPTLSLSLSLSLFKALSLASSVLPESLKFSCSPLFNNK